MMTEIIRELTAIKKTNKVTSEQVLASARRVETQRVQKALIRTTKESKYFSATKKQEQNNNVEVELGSLRTK